MRVVVVGAGFAGLAAADRLNRAGVEVVVFEARDRVGGRVWSRELPNGAVVEMGAEFILPDSIVTREMAGRFGLPLWDKGMRYGDREPRGGIGVDGPTLSHAVGLVEHALRQAGHEAHRVSAAAFLRSLHIHPGALEAIAARLEVSSASVADDVRATEMGGIAAHSTEACPSVAGGNQRLAQKLAASLGSAVRLRSPVERVEWTDSGTRVSVSGDVAMADACVVAVPATVMGRIAFQPPLPDDLQAALGRVAYGHAAKLFVPLGRRPETSAVMSVPERYWTWTATGDGSRVQPVLSCFAGSAPALRRLGVGDGPERWVRSVARLRADLSLDAEGAVLSTWDDDPWVSAAYSAARPDAGGGDDGEDALAVPRGRLFFCGEHTAGRFSALMEGALRSGVRAADQSLARARPQG